LIPFSEVKKLSLHSEGAHVLALRRGTVWAWGHNFYGQIGDGTILQRTTPVPVDDLMGVVDVSAGGNFSLALKSDGTVWTWGSNERGEMGIGTTTPSTSNRPIKIPSLSSVIAIAAGSDYSLALKSDGTVWSWGSNTTGQLGIGTTDFQPHPTPLQVPGLSGVVAIFAGDYVSYAVKADGTAFGWGTSFIGKLGDGTSGSTSINSPTELPALKGMVSAETGVGSTVIRKADGTVLSFGSNFRGQLGRGLPDNGPYPVPTQIPGLLARDVSNGDSFVIVTEPSGTLKAFGRNDDGQLGLGGRDFFNHATPVTVPGMFGAFATVTGRQSTLALIGDPAAGGTIRSWGGNDFGVLGIGSFFASVAPAVINENFTVARPNFSVETGTITPAAIQIVCGTPGSVIHYTTNGSDPTESDPVISSGSTVLVDHSLTLKARAFRSGFSTSAVKSATYNVAAPTPPQLLLDQTGPAADQAAALDVLTFLRDPFPVVNVNQLLNPPVDRNTRVAVFVTNLQLGQGEPVSAVVVNLVGSNSVIYDLPAEVVGAVPNTDFVQITFRLPDTLAVGTCTIRIKFHALTSNAGTIRIKP
jgi:alpha-tubulin suppressor-like RCC1 family protein